MLNMNIENKNSVRNALKDKSHCPEEWPKQRKIDFFFSLFLPLYFISIILANKQTKKSYLF